MGLTARDIAEMLADTEPDSDPSAPNRTYDAPIIRDADIPGWSDCYDRPAAWNAFGEPREDQQ
jgi:hypothetical protein